MKRWSGSSGICTLLQTDNHASTSSLIFYRLDAVPDAQPTVSKNWRQLFTDCSLDLCAGKWRCMYSSLSVWAKRCEALCLPDDERQQLNAFIDKLYSDMDDGEHAVCIIDRTAENWVMCLWVEIQTSSVNYWQSLNWMWIYWTQIWQISTVCKLSWQINKFLPDFLPKH